jgi:hypothetical protein
MESKKQSGINNLFNLVLKEGLTPNQFYLLYCIHNKVNPELINLHLETRYLVSNDWLNVDNKLTAKALKILTNTEENKSNNIEKYNNIFPKKKLPSGKFARTNLKNLETAFKWFFENFDYTWDIILNATALYVDEYEKKNYMYMQTSQYFIRKQMSDKSWGSELANWCAIVESGEELDDHYFKETVV